MAQQEKGTEQSRAVIELKTTPDIEEALAQLIKSQATLVAKGDSKGAPRPRGLEGLVICCNGGV